MTTEVQQEEIILPPGPPSAEEEFITNGDFVKGQFDYTTKYDKPMLRTAYQAINILELWSFMKQNPGKDGYMWSSDRRIDLIYNKIVELGYKGHSGCSFGCTMRYMQFIAREGEKLFRKNYLLSLKRKGIAIL
jgi:hypothetical protein